jgi:tetratricopeptide (TPR) repeat protein
MGYSEDVAAFRLWDDVMLINDSTPTAKDRVTLLPSSQQMDFEAPGAGISVQMVLRILRPFFGLDQTRITGEFLCTTEDCARESLALRLRVFRGGTMRIISLPTIGEETGGGDIDAYFHAAALELLRELDPYVVAFFLYQTDKAAAEREALQLVGPTHPQRKWALNLLGFIAADRGDYDEAIGFYQRAITADETEGFAIAHTNWGDALRAKGDYDEAIEHYQQALAIDPRHSVAYSGWANALADKGDMAAALEMHARAAEVDPESAFAYAHWGNALYTSGDLDGAIEKYSRATEIDPTYALGYYNWGVALEAKGDRDGAIAKYIRATELDPEDAGAITSWALVLRAKGDLDGALERFAQAAAIEPGNAFIFNNWGITLGAVGKLEMAIEKFKRAAVLDSDYSDAHFNLAVAYKLLERNAEAAAAFERYLALNPDAANAADVRAEIANLRAQIAGN